MLFVSANAERRNELNERKIIIIINLKLRERISTDDAPYTGQKDVDDVVNVK